MVGGAVKVFRDAKLQNESDSIAWTAGSVCDRVSEKAIILKRRKCRLETTKHILSHSVQGAATRVIARRQQNMP